MQNGKRVEVDVARDQLSSWTTRIDTLLSRLAGRDATVSELRLAEYLRCHRTWATHKVDQLQRCPSDRYACCREELDVAMRAIDEVGRSLAKRMAATWS